MEHFGNISHALNNEANSQKLYIYRFTCKDNRMVRKSFKTIRKMDYSLFIAETKYQ